MIKRTGILLVATCLVWGTGLSAQTRLAGEITQTVDKGPSLGSFGTRVSFLFAQENHLLAGLEFGYSNLPDVDDSRPTGGITGYSVVEFEHANRTMYHATVTARKSWLQDGFAGLYLGGGTGAYLINSRNEFWQQGAESRHQLDFQRSSGTSLEFGLNLGGGVELRPFRTAGALDLDARFHFLPFAGSAGVRSVFIVSAGLSIF